MQYLQGEEYICEMRLHVLQDVVISALYAIQILIYVCHSPINSSDLPQIR